MRKRNRISLALLILACCSCNKTSDKPVTGFDEAEMATAIAKAQSEVDVFIEDFTNNNGTDFSVKAPIKDGEAIEHFWLTEITYNNGEFEGLIGNDPGMVSNVKFGQKWTIKKSEISDWMFMRDGKMHGNYTMRPLLKTLPKEEAEQMRSILAEP